MGRATLGALLGRLEEARSLLAEKLDLMKSKYVSASDIAELFAALGETELAFDWGERDYPTGERLLAFHYHSAAFNSMRDNPRYKPVLGRLILPTGLPKRSDASR